MISTSTKTIAVNFRSSQAYIKTLSKRSFFVAILFTGLLVFCFILSLGPTRPWYLSADHERYLSYARNDTHLISNNKFTSCQGRCPTPPGINALQPKQVFEACLDKGKLAEYYLTIVIVSRNDDYGGFQYQRFQNMLDSTFLMAEDTKTRLELLIIEWNPEKDKRSIRDAYRFRRSEYLTYRIITVPREVHDTFQYKYPKPVYEFEGKNLAIKHARGEFIVCTNQDDIWSSNMYQAIRSRSWQKDMIYTQFQDKHSQEEGDISEFSTLIQLSDFPTDHEIQASCSFSDAIAEMQLPLIKNDTQPIPAYILPKEETRLDRENYLIIGHEASDFTLAHRDVWISVGGYREIGATIWIDVEFLLTAFHSKGIPITYSPEPFNCHQIHDRVIHEGAGFDNIDVQVDGIISKQVSYANTGHWGLAQLNDLYQYGLNCDVFRGGLGK